MLLEQHAADQSRGGIAAQFRLENLADRGHRDRINDVELLGPARTLADGPLRMPVQFGFRYARIGAQHNKAHRQCANVGVGHAPSPIAPTMSWADESGDGA